MTQKGKERMREAAIAALLSADSIREAAEVVGLSARTLVRWMAQPEFAAAYSAAKTALLQQATARLRRESAKAVDTLSEVAGDTEAQPSARVTAASRILELALKSHEIECLEVRIAKLESEQGE